MVYTVGNRGQYKKLLAQTDGNVKKVGVRLVGSKSYPQGYGGGYAFQTIEDAQRFLDEHGYDDYAVFGLQTTWDNTYPTPDGWWHYLVEDAAIVDIETTRCQGCGDTEESLKVFAYPSGQIEWLCEVCTDIERLSQQLNDERSV